MYYYYNIIVAGHAYASIVSRKMIRASRQKLHEDARLNALFHIQMIAKIFSFCLIILERIFPGVKMIIRIPHIDHIVRPRPERSNDAKEDPEPQREDDSDHHPWSDRSVCTGWFDLLIRSGSPDKGKHSNAEGYDAICQPDSWCCKKYPDIPPYGGCQSRLHILCPTDGFVNPFHCTEAHDEGATKD